MKEDDWNQVPEGRSEVDKGLVTMFLKMSPEERLQANDSMYQVIL